MGTLKVCNRAVFPKSFLQNSSLVRPNCLQQLYFCNNPSGFSPNQSLESQCVYFVPFSGFYALNALIKSPELVVNKVHEKKSYLGIATQCHTGLCCSLCVHDNLKRLKLMV